MLDFCNFNQSVSLTWVHSSLISSNKAEDDDDDDDEEGHSYSDVDDEVQIGLLDNWALWGNCESKYNNTYLIPKFTISFFSHLLVNFL